MNKIYAGIGSRETPDEVCLEMKRIAGVLETKGFILRSGGAGGADLAFESGTNTKEIYLPWKGFNGNSSPLYNITPKALEVAKSFHPAWDRLGQAAQKLMARNCYQVLGYGLNSPAGFVICWTKDGKASGGTGQALRIAASRGIPIYNLKNEKDKAELYLLLSKA